jgi:hypothetical protein
MGLAAMRRGYEEVRLFGAAVGKHAFKRIIDVGDLLEQQRAAVPESHCSASVAPNPMNSSTAPECLRGCASHGERVSPAGIKCRYVWRPITAIRNGDADGNASTVGDLLWSSWLANRNRQ